MSETVKMDKGYFSKIREAVSLIAENYFIDPLSEDIGGREVEHWKILTGIFSYLGNKNVLLVGSPGTGKTTYAGVISSVLSGLPYDLFDNFKIQGHPDHTKDTMLARADLSKLNEEGVVWQPSIYLPAITLDEFNRLSPGKQAILLEFIRTGSLEHLGKYFSREKPSFFATMNYNGTGTYSVPTPSLDRFDLSLEFDPGASYLQDAIQMASRNIKKDLVDPELTDKIVKYLMNKEIDEKGKLEYLKKVAQGRTKKFATIQPADDAWLVNLRYTPDAKTFLSCIWEEMNSTNLYGSKRRSDPIDTSQHNMPFANSKIKEGISPRAWDGTRYYAGILAGYLGDSEVDVCHIMAVAPYVLAHRLEFTEDYKAKFAEQRRCRGEREEQDLTRRLLDETKKNYDNVHIDLKLLDVFLQGSLSNNKLKDVNKDVKKILNGPEPDHPLLKNYWYEAKKGLER